MGEEFGPMNYEELVRHAIAGRVSPDTDVRQGSSNPWFPAGGAKGLLERVELFNRGQKTTDDSKTQAIAATVAPSYLDRLADWHFEKYCTKGILGIKNNKREALLVGAGKMLLLYAFLSFTVVLCVGVLGYTALNPVPPVHDTRGKPYGMPDEYHDRQVSDLQHRHGFSKRDAEKITRSVWEFESKR